MDDQQYNIFSLTSENAVIPLLEKKPVYGGQNPDINECNIDIRMANEPRIFNYKHICKLNGVEMPADIKELYTRFDVWLIKFSVGIMKNSSPCNVVQLGFRVKYDTGVNVQIEEMMPDTRFITPNATGGFHFNAELGATGEAKLADMSLNVKPLSADISSDLKLSMGANIGLRVSMPTLSPVITAIGKYSNYSDWSMVRDTAPLVGDQEFSQIIITDIGLEQISLQTQVYCTLRKYGLLNSSRESKWMSNKIDLPY